ncbi:hypothetical protein FEM08_31850 [Flavobacterium gilvum]|nr:hypothetical protein FEM08_31850 [Flavobacterium gilvum]
MKKNYFYLFDKKGLQKRESFFQNIAELKISSNLTNKKEVSRSR